MIKLRKKIKKGTTTWRKSSCRDGYDVSKIFKSHTIITH